MHNTQYIICMITVMALVTILLRVLPFLIFRGKTTPDYISFLGKYLPYAIIGMLVIYCLRSVSFLKVPYGIPEIASIAVVVGLHVWKRNTLISIVVGTICYMMLV